jgi:protein-disulfide isomerase
MSSRARTRERRQEREKQRRRNRQLLIVGVIAAIAVILAALLVISNLPAEATIPEETIAQYADLPTSFTEDGFPVLGNPAAPVQVVEYSSFDCPSCGLFYQNVTPALIERVRTGDISFTYVPLFGTGGIRNGEGAARAAICAGRQDAFWPYHSALFTWQAAFANQAFDGNRLEAGAANLGLDVGQWSSCLRSSETNEVLVAANGAANRLEGFTGTPTVTVNGQIVSPTLNDINTAIELALATTQQPAPEDTSAAETTSEEETAPEEASEDTEPEAEATEESAE